MSEWDGTHWEGTAVMARPEHHGPPAGSAVVTKAAFGSGVGFYNGQAPVLSSLLRSPQKVMREAQALYHSNPWIGTAERTVTRKVAGLPRHIEDENDDEVGDATTNPALKAVRDLIEKPQAALSPEDRQPALGTGRALIEIISRHAGLCGLAFVYLDQMDQNGIPLALLYVNPARIVPMSNDRGNLLGYSLDPKDEMGRGGTPLRLDELLPFYLEVPDFGHTPIGLVEAAALKARITSLADQHAAYLLGTGGRIPGIVSPRDATITDDEIFAQLERDFRNVNEAPDAAKRTTILRGPIDFTKTAADPTEMALLDLSRMNRDDILAVWGVPPSQAGVGGQTVGLNSGETRRYEQQILMQGPVHDRVTMIRETFQFQLLDRWQKIGVYPELEIEEPDFEDDSAPYELASKAREQPITNNERRTILKLDPLPDYGPDGEPLGLAIVLPSLLTTYAQGPEDGSTPTNPFPKAPKPKPAPVITVSPFAPNPQLPAKAGLGLRKSLDKRIIPAVQDALQTFLRGQRADIVARLRKASVRQLKDDTYWFSGTWDRALAKALRPHIVGIGAVVTERAKETFQKADPFTDQVEQELVTRTGARIGGINETTRQSVADAIRAGLSDDLTASQIADRIEQLPAFDDARAELVARTESGYAYNYAAVASYREYGVERVEVIDGDGDEICAAVNGRTWTLDEANSSPLGHPNCTRDFAPYFGGA